jgi:2-methylcitrate dehydratase PrpD
MSNDFLHRLCDAVLRPRLVASETQRELISRAIADTLAVAAAGFSEPVTRNVLAAYGGDGPRTWSGEGCESAEAAVMVNAVAAHALDFDDVYIESMAHISTVLLPAVLRDADDDPEAVMTAFAAGLVAAKAVARRVGQGHYRKGWHGTGTIGAFAAAAAAGRLEQLGHKEMANAFALAAAMSGGLQVKFSTHAKPAHAGFAAVAGVRAARLARAGVTGSREIFSARGYPHLYGAGDGEEEPADDAFALRPDLISVKLFPCCYATHRLVGIALDARAKLGVGIVDDAACYRLSVPAGSIGVLKYDRPANGLEAKFSAPYPFAAALFDGPPTLASFTDEAVHRPETAVLMDRVEVVEDTAQQSGGDIEFGRVELTVTMKSGAVHQFDRAALPGSPLDPPQPDALQAKLGACLNVYESWSGRPFPILAGSGALGVGRWLAGGAAENDAGERSPHEAINANIR